MRKYRIPEKYPPSLITQGTTRIYNPHGNLVSLDQAAGGLGITKPRIVELVNRGELRGHKLNRRWLVFENSLIDFQKKRENR
jgi:excisionase family DNA binding protein